MHRDAPYQWQNEGRKITKFIRINLPFGMEERECQSFVVGPIETHQPA